MTRYQSCCFLGYLLSPYLDQKPSLTIPASPANWRQLIAIAGSHLVSPALQPALRQKGLWEALPGDLQEYLAALTLLAGDINVRVKAQTMHLIGRLNQLEVEPVLLKGAAHLFWDLYEHPGSRLLSDIDVLVPEIALDLCRESLLQAGYEPRKAKPQPVDWNPRKHLPEMNHRDFPVGVELHWRLLARGPQKILLPERLFARINRHSTLQGERYSTLSPEDHMLFHLTHHFAGYHYPVAPYRPNSRMNKHFLYFISFRNLLDYALLHQKFDAQLDWAYVHRQLVDYGCTQGWRAYVEFARRLMGVPIPAAVEKRPFPPGHWRWFRLFIRFRRLYGIYRLMLLYRYKLYEVYTSSPYRRHLKKRILQADFYTNIWMGIRAAFASDQ